MSNHNARLHAMRVTHTGHSFNLMPSIAAEKAKAEAEAANRIACVVSSKNVRVYTVRYAVPVTYIRSSH
jgi:hypothetical protein